MGWGRLELPAPVSWRGSGAPPALLGRGFPGGHVAGYAGENLYCDRNQIRSWIE